MGAEGLSEAESKTLINRIKSLIIKSGYGKNSGYKEAVGLFINQAIRNIKKGKAGANSFQEYQLPIGFTTLQDEKISKLKSILLDFKKDKKAEQLINFFTEYEELLATEKSGSNKYQAICKKVSCIVEKYDYKLSRLREIKKSINTYPEDKVFTEEELQADTNFFVRHSFTEDQEEKFNNIERMLKDFSKNGKAELLVEFFREYGELLAKEELRSKKYQAVHNRVKSLVKQHDYTLSKLREVLSLIKAYSENKIFEEALQAHNSDIANNIHLRKRQREDFALNDNERPFKILRVDRYNEIQASSSSNIQVEENNLTDDQLSLLLEIKDMYNNYIKKGLDYISEEEMNRFIDLYNKLLGSNQSFEFLDFVNKEVQSWGVYSIEELMNIFNASQGLILMKDSNIDLN